MTTQPNLEPTLRLYPGEPDAPPVVPLLQTPEETAVVAFDPTGLAFESSPRCGTAARELLDPAFVSERLHRRAR